MSIGLTYDEYENLRCCLMCGVLNNYLENLECMFPMYKKVAAAHLRSRGYDCNTTMLDLLVEDGVVKPVKSDYWTQANVDRAAELFEQCEIYTPSAAMCQTFGCRYIDFLRPLLADISSILPTWADFSNNRPLSAESSHKCNCSSHNSHCSQMSADISHSSQMSADNSENLA